MFEVLENDLGDIIVRLNGTDEQFETDKTEVATNPSVLVADLFEWANVVLVKGS